MRFVRRIMALVLGSIGAIGLLLCVAAIVGCWILYAELQSRTDRAFGRAEQSLGNVRDDLAQVRDRLLQTQQELDALRQREADLPTQPPAERGLRRAVSRTAARKASPDLSETRGKLVRVTEAALVLNGILEALADVSAGERVGVDADRLRSGSNQLAEAVGRLEKIAAILAKLDPEAAAPEAVDESTRVTEALSTIIAAVRESSQRADEINDRLSERRAQVHRWLSRLAIALTAILVWIGAGQLSLFMRGWSHRRTC